MAELQVNKCVRVFWSLLICYEEYVRKSIPKVENIMFLKKNYPKANFDLRLPFASYVIFSRKWETKIYVFFSYTGTSQDRDKNGKMKFIYFV